MRVGVRVGEKVGVPVGVAVSVGVGVIVGVRVMQWPAWSSQNPLKTGRQPSSHAPVTGGPQAGSGH